MLYEIHMLKSYPPTNLNRDDTGAPKTCMFGGAMRGRISSQCLKRSWRTSESFHQEIGKENLGIRTRHLPDLVSDKLIELGVSQEYVDLIRPKISGFGNKDGKENKDEHRTAQIVFYSRQDIDAIADEVKKQIDGCENEKKVKGLKAKELQAAMRDANVRPVTVDIALFGRMVTSDAFRNVEASMQVAHAISTNKITLESDYFTAMDDLLSGDTMEEAGAAMIEDTDYNSSCYYIYASLDSDALRDNLKGVENADEIVRKTIPAILRAMAFTNPSGKQNSFAGHVLPSAILVECKKCKIPTSMVNAYVDPVRPEKGKDLVENSISKLAEEADMISANYGLPVEKRVWFCVDKYKEIQPKADTVVCSTFAEMVSEIAETLD